MQTLITISLKQITAGHRPIGRRSTLFLATPIQLLPVMLPKIVSPPRLRASLRLPIRGLHSLPNIIINKAPLYDMFTVILYETMDTKLSIDHHLFRFLLLLFLLFL